MSAIGRLTFCLAVVWLTGAALADGGAPAASQPAAANPAANKAAADDYKPLTDQLTQSLNAADGVPLLEKFIADHPGTPAADQAQAELVKWKEWAAKGLARFGPGWVPKDDVDKKNAKVVELLARADSEATEKDKGVTKAVATLTEAASINPYRADVPFKKFELLLKNNREKEAGAPLGAIKKILPNSAAAINDMGVLSARQKQWSPAFDLLLQAAMKSPDLNAIWDNFDQAVAMARDSGVPASTLNEADGKMRQLIVKIHKAGQHASETRWGNSWISEKDYESYTKENQTASRTAASINAQGQQFNAQRFAFQQRVDAFNKKPNDLRTDQDNKAAAAMNAQIKNIDAELAKLKAAAEKGTIPHEPSHAGKLVLLALDNNELQTLDGKTLDAETSGVKGPGDKPKGPNSLFN